MYDVHSYGRMMTDSARVAAYTKALRDVVTKDTVVVDVGTGTGIFALLAARFGARKVYAIDTNPCIRLARRVAETNRLTQIEFIEKSVFDVDLPEKAHALVSDCRGAFPLHGRHLDIVMHARERFLTSDGCIIPARDVLYATVVEHSSMYEEILSGFRVAGFDWQPCVREALSTAFVGTESELATARLLTEPGSWAAIDYANAKTGAVRGALTAPTIAAGTIHFIALSFRSSVGDLEYGSGRGARVYAPLFLPLDEPLAVHAGEPVSIEISALPTREDYLFSWGIRSKSGSRRQINDGLEFPNVLRHPTGQGSHDR